MIGHARALLGLVLAVGLVASSALSAGGRMPRAAGFNHTDFRAALAEAGRRKRPILLDFYADWCGYCRVLRHRVYPSARFRKGSGNFVRVTVNGERHRALMRRYRVRGFPTLLFLDRNGYELGRVDGMAPARAILRRMRRAESKAGLVDRLEATAGRSRSVGDYYRLAYYYSQVRRHQEARANYMRAFGVGVGAQALRWDALYNAGVSAMAARDFTAARAHWDRYLKDGPKSSVADVAYARFYRGIALSKLGLHKLARPDLLFAGRSLPLEKDRQRALGYLKRNP